MSTQFSSNSATEKLKIHIFCPEYNILILPEDQSHIPPIRLSISVQKEFSIRYAVIPSYFTSSLNIVFDINVQDIYNRQMSLKVLVCFVSVYTALYKIRIKIQEIYKNLNLLFGTLLKRCIYNETQRKILCRKQMYDWVQISTLLYHMK